MIKTMIRLYGKFSAKKHSTETFSGSRRALLALMMSPAVDSDGVLFIIMNTIYNIFLIIKFNVCLLLKKKVLS